MMMFNVIVNIINNMAKNMKIHIVNIYIIYILLNIK